MKAGGELSLTALNVFNWGNEKLDLGYHAKEFLEFMKGNRGQFHLGRSGCTGSPGNNNGGGRDSTVVEDSDTGTIQPDGEASTPDADATQPTCSDYYGTQTVRQQMGVMDHYVKAPTDDPAGFSVHGGYLYLVNKNYDVSGSSPIDDNRVKKLDLDEQSLQVTNVGQVDTSYSISQELSTIFSRSITAFTFKAQTPQERHVTAVGVHALGENNLAFEAGGLFLIDGATHDVVRLAYQAGPQMSMYTLKDVNAVVFAGGMVCATHDFVPQGGVEGQYVPCQPVSEDINGNASFDKDPSPTAQDTTPVLVMSGGRNTAGVAKIDETTVAVARRGVANDQNNRPRIIFWNTTNVGSSGTISRNQGDDIAVDESLVPVSWTLVNLQRLAAGKTGQYLAVAATNGSQQKVVLINTETDQQTAIDITDKTSGKVTGIVIDEDNHRLYVTEAGDEANGTPGNLIVIDFHQDTGAMSYATKSPGTSGDAGVTEQPFEGAMPIGTGLRLAGVNHATGRFYLFYMKSVMADKPAECKNGGIPIDDSSGFGKVDMPSFQMSIPRS